MKTRIAYALYAFALATRITHTSGSCDDTTPLCSKYLSLCSSTAVKEACPKTCSVCATNLCVQNNGGCQQICSWDGAAVNCSCNTGFRLQPDGTSCTAPCNDGATSSASFCRNVFRVKHDNANNNIDECAEGPDPCFLGLPAYCVNNVGSFSCQGYKCKKPGEMNKYKSGSCCRATNEPCGTTKSIRDRYLETRNENMATPTVTRVHGGTNAALSAWPWMAQFVYRGNPHCGGTLITDRWIVSAAHCFSSAKYEAMFVYLGQVRNAVLTSLDLRRREQRTIQRLISHANYTAATFANDIALVMLNQPVQSSDIINPVCLPCGETPPPGLRCWVTGFGLTENSGFSASDTLMEVDVPIVDPQVCSNAFTGIHHIDPDTMICAGYEEGKKDACSGDSGGPLVCQRADSCEWYLSGIVSFGKGCALAGYYGVYTNLINYESWIRQQLGSDSGGLCKKIYNPCRGLNDIDEDCTSKLDNCSEFPHYMEVNCPLSCCKFRNGEIKSCSDKPGMTGLCHTYSSKCRNPSVMDFMRENCRKTCDYC